MKSVLIVVGVAGFFAAMAFVRGVMERGGSVSSLDIAGAAGVFVVWAVIMAVLLVIVGRLRRR